MSVAPKYEKHILTENSNTKDSNLNFQVSIFHSTCFSINFLGAYETLPEQQFINSFCCKGWTVVEAQEHR